MNGTQESQKSGYVLNASQLIGIKKRCKKCDMEKLPSDYYSDPRVKSGARSICKLCCNEDNRERWAKNAQKYKISNRKWRIKNKDKIEKRQREWVKNNIDHYRQYHRERKKIARSTKDIILNQRMAANINHALKGKKNRRKWENIVGYDLRQLKEHLESKFTNGMNWDNIGKWHIDHIIPKSVFNFEDVSDIDFKKCWALNNLQPMWAFDNISKKDKLDKPFQPSLMLR